MNAAIASALREKALADINAGADAPWVPTRDDWEDAVDAAALDCALLCESLSADADSG